MQSRAQFADHVCDLLAPIGAVTARAMFGGFGIFAEGLMFALIADDVLYLRADGDTRPRFEERGLAPFRPFADRATVMSYFQVPPECLDDPDQLRVWARDALGAARRGASRAQRTRQPPLANRFRPR